MNSSDTQRPPSNIPSGVHNDTDLGLNIYRINEMLNKECL